MLIFRQIIYLLPPNILGQEGEYIKDFKETRFDQKKSSFPPTHSSKKKSLNIVLILFKNKICIILQFKHSNVHVIYLIRQESKIRSPALQVCCNYTITASKIQDVFNNFHIIYRILTIFCTYYQTLIWF